MLRNVFCVIALLGTAQIRAGTFNYPNFSNSTNLSLVGSAAISLNRLRMVPNSAYSNGGAWYDSQQTISSFTTNFEFQYQNIGGSTDENGNPGTDGISFYLQQDSTTFNSGDGLAHPYLSVEFVALKSSGYGDPQSSDVRITKNGVVIADVGVEPAFVYRTTNPFDAAIAYDGSTLMVGLDGTPIDSIPVSLADIPSAYVGFTGFDGTAVANEYINSWSFSSVPEPANLGLIATAGLGFLVRRRATRCA